MAIYYSPNPTTTPAATNYAFSIGDFYINQNGAIFKATAGTGLSAGKMLYPKPTGIVPPTLRPSINVTTLINNNTATRNSAFSAFIMKAVGGSAIIPTGGTSLSSPGNTPIFNFTVFLFEWFELFSHSNNSIKVGIFSFDVCCSVKSLFWIIPQSYSFIFINVSYLIDNDKPLHNSVLIFLSW